MGRRPGVSRESHSADPRFVKPANRGLTPSGGLAQFAQFPQTLLADGKHWWLRHGSPAGGVQRKSFRRSSVREAGEPRTDPVRGISAISAISADAFGRRKTLVAETWVAGRRCPEKVIPPILGS